MVQVRRNYYHKNARAKKTAERLRETKTTEDEAKANEHIRKQSAKIRAKWSESELHRRAGIAYRPVEVTQIRVTDCDWWIPNRD